GEEDAGQLDPAALTAGEGAEWQLEAAFAEAESSAEAAYVGLRRVAAVGLEALLGPREAGDVGLRGHLLHAQSELLEPLGRLVEASPRQHVGQGGDLVVGLLGARVLVQVAEAAGPGHLAARRRGGPGEDAEEGGLARTVAAHEADLVAGAHGEA